MASDPPFDATTGEVLDPIPSRAADGAALARPANNLAEFLTIVEDGGFNQEVGAELRDLAGTLNDAAIAHGGKAKAKLTITVEIECELGGNGALFYLRGSHKIASPTMKRPRSVAWATEDNRFTANKPHQGQLFGRPRDVDAPRPIRNT